MKRTNSVATAALLLASAVAFAEALPNYDAFGEATRPVPLPAVRRGHVAHMETRLGVPTVFWADQDAARPSLRSMGLTAEEAARRHLFEHAELYRQVPQAMAEADLREVHDTGRGAIIATFRKTVGGVPVFRDELHVIMDRDLGLVALTGYLTPHGGAKDGKWNLARATAIATAFFDLTGHTTSPPEFTQLHMTRGGYHHFVQAAEGGLFEGALRANGTVRVKDVWFPMQDGLVPAYYLELDVGSNLVPDSLSYAYVISALDGSLLFRKNLTEEDAFNYRVWADTGGWNVPQDGPQGSVGTPHPQGVPNGYQAPFVAPNLVTVDSLPFSRADSWLPTAATVLTGNNVEAYADRASGDGFTANTTDVRGVSTGVGANGKIEFGDTYDVTLDPGANAAQINAAITQLFFDNNFFHDWFYDHGFDEVAGNAQTSNFGRGGAENDSLKVEGQDYGGTNNANMNTPADGKRPRMQMYIFSGNALVYVDVITPASLGRLAVGTAGFGAQVFDVTASVDYASDVMGQTQGCNALPPSVAGKIVLVDRGNCAFSLKGTNAAAAGAVGLVIANNTTGIVNMSGTMSNTSLPVLSITQADGLSIKNALSTGPVTVRMLREAAVGRDGTIDNSIIAHEWAHYMSNRLVADSVGLSNRQGRSMGEGWADFNALLLSVRDSDRALASNTGFSGAYAAAPYVMSGGTNDGYYYGIRRVTYSTDMAKNGLTFGMIENGVPLVPIAPNPSFPVKSGQSGLNNSEVHNSGEVWCTFLWEGLVGLLNATSRYTFIQAQDVMKDYFVASLKATPAAPTMLEARDALLAVVYASNKQDFALFTSAFAKRGAGIGAIAPDRYSNDHIPTVQSFASGADMAQVQVTLNDDAAYCDHDGTLDDGETGNLILTVKNTGWTTLTQLMATVTSATPGVTLGNGGQVQFAAIDPYVAATASVTVTLNGVSAATPLGFSITYDEPSFTSGPKTETVEFLGNFDQSLATAATDDVEAPAVAWTFAKAPGLYQGASFSRAELGVQAHAFHAPNPSATAGVYLISPPLNVAAMGSFTFTFEHAFEFESSGGTHYDGAILEISSDAGQSWTKVPQAALSGQTYNVTLVATGSNPLKGELAFGATSPGFPAMLMTTVDLGAAYSGQTVQLRFRVGSDDASALEGWYLDNFVFTGITNTPFNQVIADTKTCVNRPPVAVVGPDQIVDERALVLLDGSMSSDADGDLLMHLWTQTSGPPVTFQGSTFIAPEVAEDTLLTLSLVATDGALQSAPVSTKVVVRHVNRAPIAVPGQPFTVEERTSVTLDGTTSFDPDGDPLVSYRWTQVGGPSVTPSDATAPAPTFIAPEVQGDTKAFFELTVSDGDVESAPSELEVTFKQVNRAPAVTLAPQETVDERVLVTLTANGSDADGEDTPKLLYVWTQTAGPTAQMTPDEASLSFTAPDVASDTPVTFQVKAWDGHETRADRLHGVAEVTFTVRHVNRKPMARAGADRTVAPGGSVVLGDASLDEDEDPLTYAWRQVAGPEVALVRSAAPYPELTAPADTALGTTFEYELRVSDGLEFSTDTVVVTVQSDAVSGCGCSSSAPAGFSGAGALFALGALALFGRRRIRAED